MPWHRSPSKTPLLLLSALALSPTLRAEEPSVDVNADRGTTNLVLKGAVGQEHVLEYSPDLVNWEPLLSLDLPASPFSWSDPLAPGRAQGFYRLAQWTNSAPPREHADNFRLIDHRGRSQILQYNTHLEAIVLLFVDPTADQALGATLKDLERTYAGQNIAFWAIDPVSETRDQVLATAERWGTNMPILHDEGQLVSQAYGVTHGTEALLVEADHWDVVYRGALEDTPQGPLPGNSYLKDALNAFLQGADPAFRRTPTSSYPIALPPVEPVSYEEAIAPLLIKHCVRCHSPGNIAPFNLTDYQTVKDFSHDIEHAVLTGEMPPWFADPAIGTFGNNSSLPREEARTLLNWVAQGSPRGEGPDPLAEFFDDSPPPSDYPTTWPSELGEPDMILKIPRQNVPADGEVDYRYLEVRPRIPRATYLKAAIIKPGNTEVVHHSLVFLGSVFETFLQGAGLNGFFAGYVPGQRAQAFPEGTGKLIPANPVLTFQMHYQPNGIAQTDETELGLYFHATPPAREYMTTAASTTTINIPAGAREYTREASIVLSQTQSTVLYEFSPHMHFRGARMEYEAVYRNGQVEKLLSVPYYEFDWQILYRLQQPKILPPGTTIRIRGAFDNSVQNHENPNPNVPVAFGEQSDDEMFIGYLNYIVR